MIHRLITLSVSFLFSLQCLLAQQDFNVTLIYDGTENDTLFLQHSIKEEIESLLGTQYNINFTSLYSNGDIATSRKYIEEVYNVDTANVLIGAGLITSQILSERKVFPLPNIAAINIDNLFIENSDSSNNSSSIPNFAFIQSPFNIKKDIEALTEIGRIKKIGILVNEFFYSLDFDIKEYLKSFEQIDFELITIANNPQTTLDAIGEDIDAVYVLSTLSDYTPSQAQILFQGITEKKLPSLSLMDYPMLEYGAYAAFSSQEDIQKIPRRAALNVSKIAEGKDPKDFPVQMESFNRQLIINMKTVNITGVYPSWKTLDNAILINVNKANTGRKLTLKAAIAEGLENNLGYQMAQKQTQIAQKDVALAKSNYLPQLEVNSTGTFLDENSVASSFGAKGEFNWSAGASFSQLILSEPAMANITIQKLFKESQEKAEKQSELDVVLDVVTAFFNYQQAQSLVVLQNEDIKVKNQNLNIAVDKEKVGYGGKSDVYRWETELALARADFNDATAQLKNVGFQLNQILNRPVKEQFSIENPGDSDYLNQIFDLSFVSLIEDPGSLQVLADFLTEEAMKNLPEVQQIELALQAQERQLKSNKRAFYIPTIALQANYDEPLKVVNPGETPSIPGIEFGNISANPKWNAGFVASIPIFNGGSRKHQKQKAQIELYQLLDQQKDVGNQLELQIRASLENVQTSYRNLQLNRNAAEAALKNVNITQDLYSEGQLNVVNFIDAQNAYLTAEINASNSEYQLVIDFFVLQRTTGQYLTLATEAQRNDFFTRFLQFKSNTKN
ncbi:Outer membrane protein TolC [Flavobacteriaceae bacterium MAR_2010_188]|nr:Outer membrane protein TolC [Flavobacteriaceae bacterium MAR_2010_188]